MHVIENLFPSTVPSHSLIIMFKHFHRLLAGLSDNPSLRANESQHLMVRLLPCLFSSIPSNLIFSTQLEGGRSSNNLLCTKKCSYYKEKKKKSHRVYLFIYFLILQRILHVSIVTFHFTSSNCHEILREHADCYLVVYVCVCVCVYMCRTP